MENMNRNIFNQLVKIINDNIKSYKQLNNVIKDRILCYKYIVTDLKFENDKILLNYNFKPLYKNIININTIGNIIENIKNDNKFQELREEYFRFTKNITDGDKCILYGKLLDFINNFIHFYFEDENNDFDEIEFTDFFINHINNNEFESLIKIELTGFEIEKAFEIKLNNSTKLFFRRIIKEDFEQEIDTCDIFKGRIKPYFNDDIIRSMLMPYTVLEINTKVKSNEEIKEIIQRTITIIRLFNPISVNIIHHDIITKYSLRGKNINSFIYQNIRNFSYRKSKLSYDLIDKFKTFFLQVYEQIPISFFVDNVNSVKGMDYKIIAYNFYKRALLNNLEFEEIISNCIMGLEALYSNNNSEISFKLTNFVSKIISFFHRNPLIDKKIISKCYDIRSKYVHGILKPDEISKITAKLELTNKEIIDFLLGYLRISILIFLLLEIDRNELIVEIQNSLIDIKTSNDLSTKIISCLDNYSVLY